MTKIDLYIPDAFTYTSDAEQIITVEPKTLTYETRVFIPGFTNPPGGGKTVLDWDTLRNRSDRCGFDRWIICMDLQLKHTGFLNLNSETFVTRYSPAEWMAQRPGTLILFHVVVRPEDQDFRDCVYLAYTAPTIKVVSNVKLDQRQYVAFKGPKTYWPFIAVTELERQGSHVTMGITMRDNVNEDIYIKTDSGVAPEKVSVVNGHATFPLHLKGMRTGEETKVSVGFRYYDGMASTVVRK